MSLTLHSIISKCYSLLSSFPKLKKNCCHKGGGCVHGADDGDADNNRCRRRRHWQKLLRIAATLAVDNTMLDGSILSMDK